MTEETTLLGTKVRLTVYGIPKELETRLLATKNAGSDRPGMLHKYSQSGGFVRKDSFEVNAST